MGFDKPDLGFVVHLGAPPSPIAYYQQVGRAGRGVERAEVLLLPGAGGRGDLALLRLAGLPARGAGAAGARRAAEPDRPLSTAALEPRVDLRRARLEMMLKVLDVDGAVRRVHGRLGRPPGSRGRTTRERYARVAAGAAAEQQAMRDYLGHRRLPDGVPAPPAGRPGRRRRAAAATTAPGSGFGATVSDAAASAAAASGCCRPGVEVEPRKMWPTGMAAARRPLSGRIPAGEQARRRAGRSGGCPTSAGATGCATLLAARTDQAIPDDVFAACVEVLPAWGWAERPVGVVGGRVADPAARWSGSFGQPDRRGRPAAAARHADLAGARPAARANSAQRLAAVWSGFAVPDFTLPAGPVLLVDDLVDTGWTMTVAARLLRRAGATAVLPLALAPRRLTRRGRG